MIIFRRVEAQDLSKLMFKLYDLIIDTVRGR